MNNQLIIKIVAGVGILIGTYFLFSSISSKLDKVITKEDYKEYEKLHRLNDSINWYIIKVSEDKIKERDVIIDSLNKSIKQITKGYENYIKDLSNVTVVSDDSIRSIISEYLNNKKYHKYK